MLRNLKGLGNSAWGMTPLIWRQAYTLIIRTIALWGAEVRRERWRKALKTLQYQSLRKCSGASYGTAQAAVDKITGVEPIETKVDAMQARYVATSMSSPIAMEGLWPADFEKSREVTGRGGTGRIMRTVGGR